MSYDNFKNTIIFLKIISFISHIVQKKRAENLFFTQSNINKGILND